MAVLTGNTDTGGVRYDWLVQQGTTFRARTFTVTVNAAPADITLVEMALKQHNKEFALYSSATGGITLGVGSFTLEEHLFDLPKGDYSYDLKVTHDGGKIDRFLHGFFKVRGKVTA